MSEQKDNSAVTRAALEWLNQHNKEEAFTVTRDDAMILAFKAGAGMPKESAVDGECESEGAVDRRAKYPKDVVVPVIENKQEDFPNHLDVDYFEGGVKIIHLHTGIRVTAYHNDKGKAYERAIGALCSRLWVDGVR